MPKITAISPQKRKGRFNVYLDGEFAFGTDEDTLVQEGLIVGKGISELEINELEEKSEVGKLYQKTLSFLGYRPRSEKEVRDYLKSKIAEDEVIVERILKQLKQQNFLNDLDFAQWWVEQRRSSSKPRGVQAIRSELYQKGVARETIEKALGAEKSTEDAEKTLAMKATQKYLKQPKSPKTPKELRQLTLYLARRGFNWEVVKSVVDKLLAKE